MEYIEELAKNWKQYGYSFDAREILPNGDEAWVYSTLELGLPVLWLKHPDGSFEHYVYIRMDMTNQLASIGVFGAIVKWSDTKIFGKFLSGDAQSVKKSTTKKTWIYVVLRPKKQVMPMMNSNLKKNGSIHTIEKIPIYLTTNTILTGFNLIVF